MGHEPKSRSQATALAEGVSLEPKATGRRKEKRIFFFASIASLVYLRDLVPSVDKKNKDK